MAKPTNTDDVSCAHPRHATNFDAIIGSRIKLRHIFLGLSQQEVADKLGLTFQQIQKYETGTNRISASRL